MFDEKSITLGLAELGYLRLKKRTYKASWSSAEVEHFLFFSLYGAGNYFVCYFGIRNPPLNGSQSSASSRSAGYFFKPSALVLALIVTCDVL
jgi:hypothetical protein